MQLAVLIVGQYHCIDRITQYIRLQANSLGIRFRPQETLRGYSEVLLIYGVSEVHQTGSRSPLYRIAASG